MKSTRPRQYWDDYASRFKNRSLAELYELRPPYPGETYEILLNLLGQSRGRVLDVGCGPGKIARSLVNHVDAVDAVNFSQSLTDYVQFFHSRESMSKEHMGAENVWAFDAELSQVLSDYVDDDGCLSFQLEARVTWGKPLA